MESILTYSSDLQSTQVATQKENYIYIWQDYEREETKIQIQSSGEASTTTFVACDTELSCSSWKKHPRVSRLSTLFPTHPEAKALDNILPLTEDELLWAAVVTHACPQLLLNMYNYSLSKADFHRRCRVQWLALITKGKGDQATSSTYRPLYMLDTNGKLLEKMFIILFTK